MRGNTRIWPIGAALWHRPDASREASLPDAGRRDGPSAPQVRRIPVLAPLDDEAVADARDAHAVPGQAGAAVAHLGLDAPLGEDDLAVDGEVTEVEAQR